MRKALGSIPSVSICEHPLLRPGDAQRKSATTPKPELPSSNCGLAAMTSDQHAEDRQVDPNQVYFLARLNRKSIYEETHADCGLHLARIELATFSV